jgi:hypothetical protein
METLLTKSIISGVLAILIFISGIFLRKSGEPYKTGIFTLHKLAVVTALVFVVLVYIQHFDLFSFYGTGLFLFLLSDIFLVAAFVTGALLNFEKTAHYSMKIVHRLTSWLTVLMIPVIWWYCH